MLIEFWVLLEGIARTEVCVLLILLEISHLLPGLGHLLDKELRREQVVIIGLS